MARLLRIALVVAAVAGAFVGGYLVKNLSSFSWAAAEPAPVADATPKPPRNAIAMTTVVAPRTVAVTARVPHAGTQLRDTRTVTATVVRVPDLSPPPMPAPPAEPSTIILPPVAVAEPPKLPEQVDPNDPGLRMIRDAMGIKTTILDKAAPPPLVLADGKRDAEPDVVPPPVPMAGPPPKLEAPRLDLDLPPVPMIHAPPAPKTVGLLNSRAVELDFEVTRAGLSKVKAVELWTTRDGGTTWTRTDRMDGARPPFRTRLGSEGEYGFRLVFESEAGMRTPDPKPGQAPDLVMVLDTAPPEIRIYPPTAGPPGTIALRWSATDTHLDPWSLRLEYSADGQSWERIETPSLTADRGSFPWVLPPGVPPRVLFRVTARDAAGNVATAVTTEKMSVDLVAPEGKVTGVRAQGREPEKGPMPRVVRSGSAAGGAIPAVLRSVLPVIFGSPVVLPAWAGPVLPVLHQPVDWDVKGNDLVAIPLPSDYAQDDLWCYWSGSEPPSRALAQFVSPRDWVARLTKTDVVDEQPMWSYERPDPLAVPRFNDVLPAEAERAIVLLAGRVRVYDPAEPEVERVPNPFNGSSGGGLDPEDLVWCFRPRERTLPMREWRQTAEATFEGFTRGQTVLKLLIDRDWKPSAAPPDSYRHQVRTAGRDRPFGGAFDVGPDYWGKPGIGIQFEF